MWIKAFTIHKKIINLNFLCVLLCSVHDNFQPFHLKWSATLLKNCYLKKSFNLNETRVSCMTSFGRKMRDSMLIWVIHKFCGPHFGVFLFRFLLEKISYLPKKIETKKFHKLEALLFSYRFKPWFNFQPKSIKPETQKKNFFSLNFRPFMEFRLPNYTSHQLLKAINQSKKLHNACAAIHFSTIFFRGD